MPDTRSILALSALAAIGLVAAAGPAWAVCRCACVGGREQNLCDRGFDAPAVCGLHACQVPPVGGPPIGGSLYRPPGTTSCRQEQVSTGRGYAWQSVCR